MTATRFDAEAWLSHTDDMRYRTRAVAGVLAECADTDGLAHPGRARLAKSTGIQARLVALRIADLMEAGLLKVHAPATTNLATTYALTTRSLAGSAIDGGRSDKDARS